MKREVVVSSIGISQDGIELQWMVLPDDVRSGATVVNSRSTAVAFTAPAGLGEAATDLRTAVDSIGLKLLELLEGTELAVYEPPATEKQGYPPRPVDDDDDEDIGMGDGR